MQSDSVAVVVDVVVFKFSVDMCILDRHCVC